MGCSTLTLLILLTYLFKPDLDPLLPLLLGSAPGTLSLPPVLALVFLGLLVQVFHQLLDSVIIRRGTDVPVPLGGEPGETAERFSGGEQQKDRVKLFQVVLATTRYSHNSLKNTSRLGSLEAVGCHHTIGDDSLAVVQAAV